MQNCQGAKRPSQLCLSEAAISTFTFNIYFVAPCLVNKTNLDLEHRHLEADPLLEALPHSVVSKSNSHEISLCK